MANDLVSADMQQRQVAVVVVHGVGDAVPAAALNELVSRLQTNFQGQFKADSHSEVRQLASPSIIPGDPDDTFPVHTRNATLTATGDRIQFYDLHWADLTKTLPGRLNAFLGAFRIIFEAHHFIDALLPRETGGVAKLLRTLLLLAASILRGPIVGLSTFLVVIGLAFYTGWPYLSMILGEDRQGVGLMWFVIALLAATFVTASTVFRYRGHSRETEWNDVLVTIIYGSVIVGGYILYKVYPLWNNEVGVAANFRRCHSIEFIYSIIQIFRATWCWLLLLAIPLVAWLYLSSLFKQTAVRPSAGAAALSLVILQSALWLALISAFAIPLIKEAALRHELAERRGRVECD